MDVFELVVLICSAAIVGAACGAIYVVIRLIDFTLGGIIHLFTREPRKRLTQKGVSRKRRRH